MSDDATEERLRDALLAVRRQSIVGPARADSERFDLPGNEGLADLIEGDAAGRPTWRRWVPAAAAAAVVLLGVLILTNRDGGTETNVTASRSEEAQAHAAAVTEVLAGCRTFQSARPSEAAPVESPAALGDWFDRYEAALGDGLEALEAVPATQVADRNVLEDAAVALERAQSAARRARVASGNGDTLEVIRLVDQARSYESIAAFGLARWGAAACDPRGVTQPTR